MSETRLARQQASSASCGCEAAATWHDSCKLVSDKRGSATIVSPSGPVSERWVCGTSPSASSLFPPLITRQSFLPSAWTDGQCLKVHTGERQRWGKQTTPCATAHVRVVPDRAQHRGQAVEARSVQPQTKGRISAVGVSWDAFLHS